MALISFARQLPNSACISRFKIINKDNTTLCFVVAIFLGIHSGNKITLKSIYNN
jgi:hypothetical protein